MQYLSVCIGCCSKGRVSNWPPNQEEYVKNWAGAIRGKIFNVLLCFIHIFGMNIFSLIIRIYEVMSVPFGMFSIEL